MRFLLANGGHPLRLADHAFYCRRGWALDVVVRLRQLAGAGFWGGLLDCFYCLSLGSLFPSLLLWSRVERAALIMAGLFRRVAFCSNTFTSKQTVPAVGPVL